MKRSWNWECCEAVWLEPFVQPVLAVRPERNRGTSVRRHRVSTALHTNGKVAGDEQTGMNAMTVETKTRASPAAVVLTPAAEKRIADQMAKAPECTIGVTLSKPRRG